MTATSLAQCLGRVFIWVLLVFAGGKGASATFTNDITISESDKTYDGQDIVVTGASLTINGPHNFQSLLLTNRAVLTHSACTVTETNKLDIVISGAVTVSSNSVIDVSGKGYLGRRTTGNTTVGGATGRCGGSYGGLGGQVSGTPNAVYGDYADPDDWGSGGGEASGGGLVRLVAGTLLLDGQVLANGSGADGGSGSGGGIYVAVSALQGAGSIQAAAGFGGYAGGGGGSGGRVAVYALDFSGFNARAISAAGTSGGGVGTVYLKHSGSANGILIINNGGTGLSADGWTPLGLPGSNTLMVNDQVIVDGRFTHVRPEHSGLAVDFLNTVTVTNGGDLQLGDVLFEAGAPLNISSNGLVEVFGTLLLNAPLSTVGAGELRVAGVLTSSVPVTVSGGTLAADQLVAPALLITNNGVLTSLDSTATAMHKLDVEVSGTITVSSNSLIDVSGKGYQRQFTTGNTMVGGATGRSGGSYGGLGGQVSGAPNAVYGDFADPEDWGSGGGYGGAGAGGGLVRLFAGTLVLDGQLLANGFGSFDTAGSGGGISVAVDRIQGIGIIHASGGSDGVPGGGGRIAVYALDFSGFDPSRIQAPGGASAAGTGTVYVLTGTLHTHVRHTLPGHQLTFPTNNPTFFTPIQLTNGVAIQFNRPIATNSFAPDKLLIQGPLGAIVPTGISLVGDRLYRIDFAPQVENGFYRFTLLPTLLDADGLELDQNANGIPGEADDGYSFTLILDTVPPRVTQQSPAGDIAGTADHVDVSFSEEVDLNTLTSSAVSIFRPDTNFVALSGIQPVGLNRVRISFAPQTLVGQYRLHVGTNVTDLAGNPLSVIYDGAFNLVPLDLELSSVTVSTNHLWVDDFVTFTWTGRNKSGAPLLGDWTDAVYLSPNSRWDFADTQLNTTRHTGGLTNGEVYTQAVTVPLPGLLPSPYYVIVRADIFNEERESGETNNQVVFGPLPLSVPILPVNSPAFSGSLTAQSPSRYFAITLAPGESLRLTLHGQPGSTNELYLTQGSIPDRQTADQKSLLPGSDQQIILSGGAAGATYYVLVHTELPGNGTPFNLTAETGSLFVSGLTPDRASNLAPRSTAYGQPSDGRVVPHTATLNGAGFTSDALVEFIGSNGVVHVPTNIVIVSSSEATLDLDLPNWPAGVYDVRVTKGTISFTLTNAFTVLQAGKWNLEASLIPPAALGFFHQVKHTVWLHYKNTGDAAMPAPLFKIGVTPGAITADLAQALRLIHGDAGEEQVNPVVQLMGRGSGATPGTLQPGDEAMLQFYYVPPTTSFGATGVNFSLSYVTADNVSWQRCDTACGVIIIEGRTYEECYTSCFGEDWHVDWSDSVKNSLRPPSIVSDAWDAIWSNLPNQLGTEWGDYVVALGNQMNYLHTIGQETTDVSRLWAFTIAQAAAALHPVRTLTSAVDAAAPAPGLPLAFRRVYGQPIISRYRIGSLGRGWSHNWDTQVQQLTNGDVVLHGPGGLDRSFSHNVNGSFTPQPGDYAVLTMTSGTVRLVETDGITWQFRADFLLDFVQDNNSNRISCGYNSALLTTLTHSNGKQFLLDYDSNGRLLHLTDPLSPGSTDDRVTTYQYDSEHLLTVTAPGNRITTYTYETNNSPALRHALRSITHADNTHDYFSYDSKGRLAESSSDGGAQAVTFSYDDPGTVTVSDATSRQNILKYGLDGQLAQARDGAGRVVNFSYSTNSLLSRLIGPGAEQYRYAYDPLGNPASIQDPQGGTSAFAHEPAFSRLTRVADARQNGQQYAYDSHGNLTGITYPDGTHEFFAYNARGSIITSTNRRGGVITYGYNAAGQLTSKDYASTLGVDFTYAYDAAGNVTNATDASGATTTAYDKNTDRLLRINYPGGKFFTFGYDNAGRRTQRTDQDGNLTAYVYDSIGRLGRMTNGAGELIVHYEYDAAGRIAKKTLGNGVFTIYEYDPAGRIIHLINYKPDATVLSHFDYTYDGSGRRISMSANEGTYAYRYDALGQMTSVTFPGGQIVSYTYDAAGNRTQVTDNGVPTSYAANALNQYTSAGAATYSFDADGNLTNKIEGGISTTYTYDAENRLVVVVTPTDTWNYGYDAFGNRILSTHNGVATRYVIDPTGLGNVAAEYDGSGNLIARYDHGFGLLDRTGSTSTAFYTFSAIGNTSELSDQEGTLLNSYTYDPFGLSLMKNETVPNPFEFVGEFGVASEGNGLKFMRARWFDTQIGRMLQMDPIGIRGGLQLYTYASSNPIERVDPMGTGSFDVSNGGTWKQPTTVPPWLPNAIDDGVGAWQAYDPNNRTPEEQQRLEDNWDARRQVILFDWDEHTMENLANPYHLRVVPRPRFVPDPIPSDPNFQVNETANTPHISPYVSLPVPPEFNSVNSHSSTIHPLDPNDKIGPQGYGRAGFVTADNALSYQVLFENKADATGPAQQIVVTDTLDPSLDLSTLVLTEIAFANQIVTVPPGLNHYEAVLSFTAGTNQILADVEASLDLPTRTLTLTIRAIDPSTGWFPEDPLVGILYPEDGTGIGQGSLSYVVSPFHSLPSGTEITNRASIVFDSNNPIATPEVSNTLDSGVPASQAQPLSALNGRIFQVNWAGHDDSGGSGVAGFDVYATVDGTNTFRWLTDTSATSAIFTGAPGHVYAFSTVAHDNVGNQEARHTLPDTFTFVPTNAPVLLSVSNTTVNPGQTLSITNGLLSGIPFDSFKFSLGPNAPAGVLINATNGLLRWTPACSQASRTNVITVVVTDTGNTNLSDVMSFAVAVSECVVPTLGRQVLRVGDTGRVPINLISSVPLTNLEMTVVSPPGLLIDFSVEPIVPEICATSIQPLTNSLQSISLLTCPNQSLIGTQQVAWLNFKAVTNQPSAFLYLELTDLQGHEPDGSAVANFAPQAGRVVVVGEEPLLEMVLGTNANSELILYGKPGYLYFLEESDVLLPQPKWGPWQQITLTNLFVPVEVPITGRERFYRARR